MTESTQVTNPDGALATLASQLILMMRPELPLLPETKVPLDPWDHEYKFVAQRKHNPNTFDVWSTGPDGQDGTADDIGNWE